MELFGIARGYGLRPSPGPGADEIVRTTTKPRLPLWSARRRLCVRTIAAKFPVHEPMHCRKPSFAMATSCSFPQTKAPQRVADLHDDSARPVETSAIRAAPPEGLAWGIFNQLRIAGCQKHERQVLVLRKLGVVCSAHDVELHFMPIGAWMLAILPKHEFCAIRRGAEEARRDAWPSRDAWPPGSRLCTPGWPTSATDSNAILSPTRCGSAAARMQPFGKFGAPIHFNGLVEHEGAQRLRERCRWAPLQRSVCSERIKASSTSMPRYLTVLSNFEWPSRSWHARKLPVRL